MVVSQSCDVNEGLFLKGFKLNYSMLLSEKRVGTLQERNAATLLFSSLCTRIFGVKRTKLELSKKNAMQARMFFNRYPKMYPFLLNEMSEVAEIMEKSTNALKPEESALYPSLILLAKLQPTVAINGSSEDQKYQVRYKFSVFTVFENHRKSII